MSMLEQAKQQSVAYGKVGIYGDAGSGKTFTASCLAIGLHKFAKCDKPIAFFDTEPGATFVRPLFKAAGIEFMVYDRSRALKDLMKFMDEVEQHCSVLIIDSITHIWRDAQDSYLAKVNEDRKKSRKFPLTSLEFHHWKPIKAVWSTFTDRFLSSKVHVIVCGRAGSLYEYQLNETTGKKELITTGTRMATEKELGYEPPLLIEMIKSRENGGIVNKALVEKDRSNFLNGEEIAFEPHTGVKLDKIYNVFEKFKPHFESLSLGEEHFGSMNVRDSKDLYTETGEDNWSFELRQRTIWCEEIQALLLKYYPSQTAEHKKAKSEMVERFFGTGSWTKVESLNSETLKKSFLEMKAFFEAPKTVEGEI